MKTYEAIYEKGKLKFKKNPRIKKAKVLVTFFTETTKGNVKFPAKHLGKLKNIDRADLFNEYLSDRY
ncbi:MAG: hypothetical protein ACTSO2_19840 [Promethearchaeota archaeon]